jgi:hypothetical protein
MAGKGPPPKPAALRQRTNRKAGAREIITGGVTLSSRGIPELFDRSCPCGISTERPPSKVGSPRKKRDACAVCLGTGVMPWHRLTMAWWRDVWTSEVKGEYLHVDIHGLYRLAVLVDRYWRESDSGLSVQQLGAEIRLQQQAYGITPLDRTRLQWEVDRGDAPEKATPQYDEHEPEAEDPRKVLRMVK